MNMLNHVQAFKKALEQQFPQLLKEEKQAIPIAKEFKLGNYSARAVQASWNVFFHLEKYLKAWVADPQKLAQKLVSNLDAINDDPWMVCVVDDTGLALAETLKKYINARLEQKDLLKEGGACLALALKIFPQIAASATDYLNEMKNKLDYEIKKHQFQKRLNALLTNGPDDSKQLVSVSEFKARFQKALREKQDVIVAGCHKEAQEQLALFLAEQQALNQLLQEIDGYLATPAAQEYDNKDSTIEKELSKFSPLYRLSQQKESIANRLDNVSVIIFQYNTMIALYEAEIKKRAQQTHQPLETTESDSESESDNDDSSPETFSTPSTALSSRAPSPKAASSSGALSKENDFSLPPVANAALSLDDEALEKLLLEDQEDVVVFSAAEAASALPSAAPDPDKVEHMFVEDTDSAENGLAPASAPIRISIRLPAASAPPPASKINFSIVISDAKSDEVVHDLLVDLNNADEKHAANQQGKTLDYIQTNISALQKYTSSHDEKFDVALLHHKLSAHVEETLIDINSCDNCLKQLEKLIKSINASVENANFIKNFLEQLATTIEILKEKYLVAKLQEICARYQQALNAQLQEQALLLPPEDVARFCKAGMGEQLDFNATKRLSLNPKDDKQSTNFYRDIEIFQAITALQRDLATPRNPANLHQGVKSDHGKLVHFQGEFNQFMEKGFSVPLVEHFARDVRKEIVRFDEGAEQKASPSTATSTPQQPAPKPTVTNLLPTHPAIKSNSWWNNILGGICCTLGVAGIASGFLAIPGAVLLALGAALLIGQPIKETHTLPLPRTLNPISNHVPPALASVVADSSVPSVRELSTEETAKQIIAASNELRAQPPSSDNNLSKHGTVNLNPVQLGINLSLG